MYFIARRPLVLSRAVSVRAAGPPARRSRAGAPTLRRCGWERSPGAGKPPGRWRSARSRHRLGPSPGPPAEANRVRSTKHSAIQATTTTRWLTSCRMPCQLSTGAPSGAPAGKPAPGSVVNTPAATSPAPIAATSRGAQRAPGPSARTRRSPAEQASIRPPVATKLAICTQPPSPRASRLIGWRVKSYPSRTRPCASQVRPSTGPAARPAASSRRSRVEWSRTVVVGW